VHARGARDSQRQPSVVERAQPRQQQVALGHQHGGRRGEVPRIGALQTADQLEQRGLAAAGRSYDGKDLAAVHSQGHTVERRDARASPVAIRASQPLQMNPPLLERGSLSCDWCR